MALIHCPECKKEISDKAASCPACGFSINATTVEQTNKKYKKAQIIGALIIVIGVLMIIAGSLGWGAFITFIGLATVAWSRFGAWWNNG